MQPLGQGIFVITVEPEEVFRISCSFIPHATWQNVVRAHDETGDQVFNCNSALYRNGCQLTLLNDTEQQRIYTVWTESISTKYFMPGGFGHNNVKIEQSGYDKVLKAFRLIMQFDDNGGDNNYTDARVKLAVFKTKNVDKVPWKFLPDPRTSGYPSAPPTLPNSSIHPYKVNKVSEREWILTTLKLEVILIHTSPAYFPLERMDLIPPNSLIIKKGQWCHIETSEGWALMTDADHR